MPCLKIQTNVSADGARSQSLLAQASRLVAERLGKPETYMMVLVEPGLPMLMGGTDDPAAYLELRGLGLQESHAKALSKGLCDLLEAQLHVPSDRVYIVFTDVSPSMWGWRGSTF